MLLVVSGCSRLATVHDKSDSLLWSSSGKLALRVKKPQGDSPQKKNIVLGFTWQQTRHRYTIQLSGTLGFGSVKIVDNGQNVSLFKGSKKLGQADKAEELLFQQTGLALPVSLLQHWIVGKPDPTIPYSASKPIDLSKTPTRFNQAGWQIEYSRSEVFDTTWRPTRLSASSTEFALKAVIKSWSGSVSKSNVD